MEQKYKVLAVDDNPINLKLLSRALINSDYEIFTASSGKEALELARNVHPDIILLDVMMPDMDGYQVCKKLQENEETAVIPVIFLSAKNEPVDKAKGLSLGAVDYLTKPFNPLEINARVRTHLSARKTTIHLIRKNQELQKEIEQLKKRAHLSRGEEVTTTFLDKITGQIYHVKEKSYQLFAVCKTLAQPCVRMFIPVLNSSQHLILLGVNGYEKNYPSLLVEHLVQKFVEGFFESWKLQRKPFTADLFKHLFEKLLERFSPDIYRVAFTFSILGFDFTTSMMYYLGLHQSGPFAIDRQGHGYFLNGDPIPIDSEVSNFITAFETSLKPDHWIGLYLKDVRPVEEEEYRLVFTNGLKNPRPLFQEFLLSLEKEIKAEEQDKSLAVVEIKNV